MTPETLATIWFCIVGLEAALYVILDGGNLGIGMLSLFPQPKEINDKIPTIEIPNTATIDGGPYPAQSTGPIYNISNNFTKIAGNHTFKMGADFRRYRFDDINGGGTLLFGSIFSSSSLEL